MNDYENEYEYEEDQYEEDTHEVMAAYSFIIGGKAEFTIKNVTSGKKFKYKVKKSKYDNVFYISVKRGNDYEYAGSLNIKKGVYSKGKNGIIDSNHPAIKGLLYALRKGDNPLPRPMIMLHHGKCACCSKKLDDELSVSRGFGPICYERIFGRK